MKMDRGVFTSLWNEGLAQQAIADKLGIHRETVRYYRRKFGLAPRPLSFSTENRTNAYSHVAQHYAENGAGLTLKAAAECYGVSETTIMNWRNRFGLSTPRQSAEPKPGVLKPPKPVRRFWAPIVEPVDPSQAAMARQHLRRHFGNVFACDIIANDGPKQVTWAEVHSRKLDHEIPNKGKGYSFVSGRGVMADRDMIALARAYDFTTERMAA